MPTTIANLWTPAVWVEAVREKQATFPVVSNSAAVVKSAQFDEFASGAGTSVNVPFFKDITDQDDEIQVENTAPVNDLTITAGTMVAPVLNRVTKHSVTALSGAVSGSDPLAEIVMQLVASRGKQRQKTLLAILRGSFGTGTGHAISVAAPLSTVRLVAADESGVGATAAQIMSADLFINAKALMGELANDLVRGAFFVHPTVLAALEKADASSFKTGIQSGLPWTVTTYRGVPVYACEALVRAGTSDGSVYDSYLLSNGIIAHGEKPQATDEGDTVAVAALQYDSDKDKNNAYVYDRTRFLMHLNGMKWVGTAAGQSATNAELSTIANWNLVYSSASRVGAVAIQTNG